MSRDDLVGIRGDKMETGWTVEDGGYLYQYSVITNQHMLYYCCLPLEILPNLC